MINLQRWINIIDKKYMKACYDETYNFESWTKWKIHKLFKLENDRNLVENFLMNKIAKWVKNNYQETDVFFNKLKRGIKKSKIKLSDVELDKILTLEERIFSKTRNIKELMVNINLKSKEHAGAKFINAQLISHNKFLASGDLIITNFRIILESVEKNYSFYYKDITKYLNPEEELSFMHKRKKIVLKIHDQKSLINTFNNLYQKKVNKLV